MIYVDFTVQLCDYFILIAAVIFKIITSLLMKMFEKVQYYLRLNKNQLKLNLQL